MKNVKRLSVIVLTLILSLSTVPSLTSQARFPLKEPITVSAEMGRYDPEPNCRKDVDGCYPKHWVSTTEFQPGTSVWMKVTITNRSELSVVTGGWGPDSAWIRSLVDATGKTPELTEEGCWDRDPTCPFPDNRIKIITAAPPNYWNIMPGSSGTISVEVSRDFTLQPQGEFVLLPQTAGLYLTSKAFTEASKTFFNDYQFDDKQAKPIVGLKMKPLRFTVLNER